MLMDAESSLHEKLTKEYDRIKGLDAENAKLKQGKNILSDLLYKMEAKANNLEAENERLKALNTKVNDGYEALWDIIREQRKLITGLCLGIDAVQLDTCTPRDWEMLNRTAERARETTQ